MIARQWFVTHMPLWGLIREGMFWLDYAARVLNFMLGVKNQNISLVTQAACTSKTAGSRAGEDFSGEMIKA